jgi:hypothetical protein
VARPPGRFPTALRTARIPVARQAGPPPGWFVGSSPSVVRLVSVQRHGTSSSLPLVVPDSRSA